MSGARGHIQSIVEIAKSRLGYSLDEAVVHDLKTIANHARAAMAELPASVPPPDVDAQLEAAARSDADEILRPRVYPTRDTDPAAPAFGEGDGVLEPSGR